MGFKIPDWNRVLYTPGTTTSRLNYTATEDCWVVINGSGSTINWSTIQIRNGTTVKRTISYVNMGNNQAYFPFTAFFMKKGLNLHTSGNEQANVYADKINVYGITDTTT